MGLYNTTAHQKSQIKVIDLLEKQANDNSLKSSVVEPTENYDNDRRRCLTSVHLPNQDLIENIEESLIKPLHKISPSHYYYKPSSLHLTIKNVRVINDPPNFSDKDIATVKEVFNNVIPKYNCFRVYFYRLMLFPLNLALIGTTDPELDNIILNLDKSLKKAGVPDDKKYVNSKHFFCNMTLARFNSPPTEQFKNKVKELSENINIKPYTINSVTLLTANAALKKQKILGVWSLK